MPGDGQESPGESRLGISEKGRVIERGLVADEGSTGSQGGSKQKTLN